MSVTWIDQHPADLLTQVGEWLEGRGDLAQAAKYYEAALKVAPDCSLAAYRAGKLALAQGEFVEAERHLRHAVRYTPDHAPTLYYLALSLERQSKVHQAVFWARRTLRWNPQHDGAMLLLLRCAVQLRRWKSVIRQYQSLPERLKQAGESKLWVSLAYAHLGYLHQAKEMLQQVSSRVRRNLRSVVNEIEDVCCPLRSST